MLNAINTKLLIAILGVLSAIGTLLVMEHRASEKAAAEAAKAAAILQEKELEQKAQETAQKREYEEFLHTIRREKQKHVNDNQDPSKTWKSYVP